MKISIFLAEDELIIRESIKKNINWELEGFHFLGAAADGELALPIILENKPDILISDIKMPFLDGIELATIVKKKLPQTKILFLTGYKEFTLAQKAINIGVTDYLLKPITTQKLLSILKDLSLEIESERENDQLLQMYKKEMNEKKIVSRNNFFHKLTSNTYSTSSLIEISKSLDIDLVGSQYSILLLKLNFNLNSIENEQKYTEIIHSLPISDKWIIFNRGNEGLGILCIDFDKQVWDDNLKKICKLLNSYPDLSYFGSLGPVVNRISEIHKSFNEANKAFALRFFINETNIIKFHTDLYAMGDNFKRVSLFQLNKDEIDRTYLKRFLKYGEFNEIKDFIYEYVNSKYKASIESGDFRHYLLMDTCICCSEFLLSIGLKRPELEKISIEGSMSSNTAKLINGLISLLEQTLKLRDSISFGKHKAIIDKTKTFMDENYNNKEMSLNYVAKKMAISANYLSTIFSRETNETFIEYLTKLRVEKAKDLLITTDLRSCEIAFSVGYQDAHYFSYIFKKYTSLSPRDFRKGKN